MSTSATDSVNTSPRQQQFPFPSTPTKRKSVVIDAVQAIAAPAIASAAVLRTPPRFSPVRASKIAAQIPETPNVKVTTPLQTAAISECAAYHFASYVDKHIDPSSGNIDTELRKCIKRRKKLPYHTVAIGSAEKDKERLKKRRFDNEALVFISPSKEDHSAEDAPKYRMYAVHENPTKDGRAVPYPVRGPNLIPMTGAEFARLVEDYSAYLHSGGACGFGNYVKIRVDIPEINGAELSKAKYEKLAEKYIDYLASGGRLPFDDYLKNHVQNPIRMGARRPLFFLDQELNTAHAVVSPPPRPGPLVVSLSTDASSSEAASSSVDSLSSTA